MFQNNSLSVSKRNERTKKKITLSKYSPLMNIQALFNSLFMKHNILILNNLQIVNEGELKTFGVCESNKSTIIIMTIAYFSL